MALKSGECGAEAPMLFPAKWTKPELAISQLNKKSGSIENLAKVGK
jgi:hypothetical protein